MPWNTFAAESISVVALKLQTALLDGKLMTYVIEWCETENTRQPGVAYEGMSVIYDQGEQIVTTMPPSSTNDIYLRIPHRLKDPVAQAAKATLHTFLKQTFWCNSKVWHCMNAAQALVNMGG